MKFVIWLQHSEFQEPSRVLAKRFGVELCEKMKPKQYALMYDKHGLNLVQQGREQSPLHVDFCKGPTAYRLQQRPTKKDAIFKAIGSGAKSILDATAGLGRDAMVFASWGLQVIACERSPAIFALFEDALLRAMQNPKTALLAQRVKILNQDAKEIISKISAEEKPDIIYLDPMFPERKKSALVKKEMQYLQDFIGADLDSEKLLKLAIEKCGKKTIVKRPAQAEALLQAELTPQHRFIGESTCYDVYQSRTF